MALRIGDLAPEFEAETTEGRRLGNACSLQLTAKHKVATPVNWKQGDDVIIAGFVSDDEAKTTYPQGWKAPRPYIRSFRNPGHRQGVM